MVSFFDIEVYKRGLGDVAVIKRYKDAAMSMFVSHACPYKKPRVRVPKELDIEKRDGGIDLVYNHSMEKHYG